jgi:transcriptional regulator with XRE-family HTH domain
MARYPNGVNYKFKKPRKPEADDMMFRVLRALRGHTNKDISQLSGLSPSTIGKWRQRKTRYGQHVSYMMALKAVKARFEILDDEDKIIK